MSINMAPRAGNSLPDFFSIARCPQPDDHESMVGDCKPDLAVPFKGMMFTTWSCYCCSIDTNKDSSRFYAALASMTRLQARW